MNSIRLTITAFVPALFVFLVGSVSAETWYIDPSTPNEGTGSQQSPFRNASSVPISSGDALLFKRGSSTHYGGIEIEQDNVVLGHYGQGAQPVLEGNNGDWFAVLVRGNNVTVDNLKIRNAGYVGVFVDGSANGTTIKNCDISDVNYGISIRGKNTSIRSNFIHNTNTQINPEGDDDAGAVAIKVELGAENCEIAYNRLSDNKDNSPDYGTDGGAIELWRNVVNIWIHHNRVENNDGFFELGGNSNDYLVNIAVYYNEVINNGEIGGLHLEGNFRTNIINFEFINNTVYDVQGELNREVFWTVGNGGANQVKFINNIVYFDGFARFSSSGGIVHQNNVFYSPSGTAVGFNFHSSEQWGYPRFYSSNDFRISNNSIAVNAGQFYEYTKDFKDTPISGNPDIGAHEAGN